MAYKITWSLHARDDLREIVKFIASDNPAIAEKFGFRLISKVNVLATSPLFGRVVPEIKDETIRELILRPYRIIYQVEPEQDLVAIARVWHGARGEPEIPKRLEF